MGYTACMSPENMKLYNFRARPTLMDEFTAICEARNETISEALRDLIKAHVRRNRKLLEDQQHQVTGRRGTPEPPTRLDRSPTTDD